MCVCVCYLITPLILSNYLNQKFRLSASSKQFLLLLSLLSRSTFCLTRLSKSPLFVLTRSLARYSLDYFPLPARGQVSARCSEAAIDRGSIVKPLAGRRRLLGSTKPAIKRGSSALSLGVLQLAGRDDELG